jgi:hypothetical protein
MKKKALPLLLLTIASLSTFAQLDSIYNLSKEDSKIVYSNTIKVFLGQKCLITPITISGKITKFELISSNLSDLKSMADISKRALEIYGKSIVKENQLYVEFNLVIEKQSGTNSVLIVNNPWDRSIIYKAKIFNKKNKSYEETSINRILPGTAGIETWPYEIESIILYDFSFTE